jgi:transposase InsO family protein
MKRAYNRKGVTRFERVLRATGRIHTTIQPGKPWQNGFIERSNRTDNEALFQRVRFRDSEERKYQLKLWEYEYNFHRPHQGLDDAVPAQKFKELFPIQAWTMGIT